MAITLDGTLGITSPAETVQGALTTTGNTILGDASTDTLNVGNGGLVKDASGNVGIGTASPTTKLQVQKNGKSFQLWDASTNDGAYMVYAGASTTKNWCIGNQFNVSGALEFTQTSASGGTTIGTTPSMVIDSSGNVGIGTSSPSSRLEIIGVNPKLTINANDAINGRQATLSLISGASADPYSTCQIMYGAINSTTSGTLTFVEGDGTERMRVTSDGDLCIGANNSESSRLRATRTNGQNVLYVSQEAATNNSTAVVYQTVAGGNGNQNIGLIVAIQAANTGDRIITGQFWNSGSPQDKFYVQRDGTTNNATGSYGTISDVRIKQDIIDATPQWEDFKKIKFRKYRMISDVEALGNDAPYLMGAVAQELEAAGMKGLVETPLDAEGNETDLHKTVKLSIMYMKGMKALQEAMERIEILETRLNALEGN